jgi:recombination protein RecA
MNRGAPLRIAVESALAGRVSAPFTYRDRKILETVPSGIPEIDSLTGGLPRGSLTEICGPPSSGRTSILLSALVSRTAQPESCALIDARDAFDPHSAEAAGVNLRNLLWVRCSNADQSLRAADLLLQGGGFGLIVLDLSDIPPEVVRYIPLNAWFRFRKTVEDTPTILLLLDQEPNAKTCASLVLTLGMSAAHWNSTSHFSDAESIESNPFVMLDTPLSTPSHASLLDGFQSRAEILRSKIEPAAAFPSHHHRFAPHDLETVFAPKTVWSSSDRGSLPAGKAGLPAHPKPK